MKDLYIRKMSLIDSPPKDSYLNRLPVVKHLAEHGIEFHRQVTFFVGENGSGKSTLIEALAVSQGFNPEGGTKNFRFSTEDSHSELYYHLRVARGAVYPRDGFFLRAESFYNVASNIDQMDREPGLGPPVIASYGSRSLHKQSHGESFLALAQTSFRPNGLYLLDEPEAALSPQRQLTLLLEIDRCAKEESQFLIVTHSPILLALPGAEILSFDDGQIHPCAYEETDSYQVTAMFINHREQILRRLLEE